jgi:hypothetical protein
MHRARSWTCRSSGQRCFALDSEFVASRELLRLGRKIALGNSARPWRATSDLQPAEPLGYNGGAKRPWLFKRNWKTKVLLLVHAARQVTYGELAIAIGTTYEGAARATQYLIDDGLLLPKKLGRIAAVVSNLRGHPLVGSCKLSSEYCSVRSIQRSRAYRGRFPE